MMLRLFVAVDISSEIRSGLSSLQGQLKTVLPQMNWVRPESIHLTLKFLGAVDSSRISQVMSVLEPIGKKQTSFSVDVQNLGVFPHLRFPRIFWIGIAGKTQALHELVLEVEAALESLGFPPEEKSYHPHLTLARIKRGNAAVGMALRKHRTLELNHQLGALIVDRFTLFQSDLDASGARYSPLGTVLLSDGLSA